MQPFNKPDVVMGSQVFDICKKLIYNLEQMVLYFQKQVDNLHTWSKILNRIKQD